MPDEVGDEADEYDGGRQSSAACGPRTEPDVAAHRFSVVFVSLTVQTNRSQRLSQHTVQ